MDVGSPRTVELQNEEELAYRASPDGEIPVILLHGNLSSSLYWDVVFETVDDRFGLYAPDMRGFGDSTYETPIDSLDDFAEDVTLFADELGLDTYALWGWSAGAGVAMAAATRQDTSVEDLVLMAPPSTQGLPIYERDENMASTGTLLGTRAELRNDPMSVAPAKAAIDAGDPAGIRELLEQQVFIRELPTGDRFETYVEETLKQQNLLDVMYALTNFNISTEHSGVAPGSGKIDDIDAPSLVLRGVDDKVCTPGMADRVVADLPNTEFRELPACGHAPTIDATDRVVDAVESFLDPE